MSKVIDEFHVKAKDKTYCVITIDKMPKTWADEIIIRNKTYKLLPLHCNRRVPTDMRENTPLGIVSDESFIDEEVKFLK